jgi:hypothetical protein
LLDELLERRDRGVGRRLVAGTPTQVQHVDQHRVARGRRSLAEHERLGAREQLADTRGREAVRRAAGECGHPEPAQPLLLVREQLQRLVERAARAR